MFLEELTLAGGEDASLLGSLLIGLFLQFMVIAFFFIIGVYVYTSFAMMAIAKKARHPHPELVWIPFVGQGIVTAKIAKMHWWPLLLIIGGFIPLIGWIFSIAVCVFSIIWMWKTFEAIKKPGWWAILQLIPVVGLVLLGIAAWEKK
jgi:hypothetical protein